ncbi:nitroreductase family protein [Bittarella massiliensis (ex Durand et al. 2017)]|uniref:nitroreductase family protein n=1 Tax=Bittarella massiliensis (ex Durand et al. 2017) TaxID=1720313 RepID=UPI001AA1926D|nr:nitroreductase family protein [Bittarella massiliensis (ex Durand et al. 2017)]MBO1679720.1 4Fe-4S binding protein [Bittarella massiliensis (ex Durand et al. 2017)]
MKQRQVIIDRSRCVGCGLCSRVCVAHNIAVSGQKAGTIGDACIFCGQCLAVCPQKAISMAGCGDGQVEKKGDVRLCPDAVLDVIRFRRSIRTFQQRAVPREVLEQVLEAGRLTHTAKNAQDLSFVVLDRERDRVEGMALKLFRAVRPIVGRFSPLARNSRIDDHFFFFRAPIAIAVLAENRTNGVLAAQNMEFVAEANGLGVLYSGFFTMAARASRKIKQAIGVPKGKQVAMTLVLGYPGVKFLRSTPHRELDARYL